MANLLLYNAILQLLSDKRRYIQAMYTMINSGERGEYDIASELPQMKTSEPKNIY